MTAYEETQQPPMAINPRSPMRFEKKNHISWYRTFVASFLLALILGLLDANHILHVSAWIALTIYALCPVLGFIALRRKIYNDRVDDEIEHHTYREVRATVQDWPATTLMASLASEDNQRGRDLIRAEILRRLQLLESRDKPHAVTGHESNSDPSDLL